MADPQAASSTHRMDLLGPADRPLAAKVEAAEQLLRETDDPVDLLAIDEEIGAVAAVAEELDPHFQVRARLVSAECSTRIGDHEKAYDQLVSAATVAAQTGDELFEDVITELADCAPRLHRQTEALS